MSSEITVLTFDCYGTLIDWERGILATVTPLFSHSRFKVTPEAVLKSFVAHEARLEAEQWRRIIVIGSITADRSGWPGVSVYSMTKAAVAVLARGLAIDFAPRGITVNTIQPGPTETDMNPGDGPHSDAVKSLVPLKRLGHADEIAAMVAFVASPEASFVTGAALSVDGGYLA